MPGYGKNKDKPYVNYLSLIIIKSLYLILVLY